MRTLILGATGQVAQSLLETAPQAQSGDTNVEERRQRAITALGRPDIDFRQPESLDAAIDRIRPDIIINAAAYTAVDKAESEAEAAFAINRDGAAAAAAAAARHGARFIHLSTDFVFDGTKDTPYSETDQPRPLGVYARSKYEGEQAVRAAHPEAVIVRLSWVYSAFGSNFAKTMLRLADSREEIGVVADQHGRPSAADDLARALWRMAEGLINQPASHQLYHLGPQGEASWAEFAERIMAASRAQGGPYATIKRITTADYPTPAQRPANAVLDCSRFQADWGVSLPDWRESCDRVIARIVASAQQDNRA